MLTIRPGPDDAEAIARVHVHGWQAGYAGIMPAEVLVRLNPAAWAQRRRDLGTADPEHPFTTLLAEMRRAVVGFTTFGPYRNNQDRGDLDPTYGEVLAIYVEPAHWGDGTARALLAAARDGLAASGWRRPRAALGARRQRPGAAGSTSGPAFSRTVAAATRCRWPAADPGRPRRAALHRSARRLTRPAVTAPAGRGRPRPRRAAAGRRPRLRYGSAAAPAARG